MLLNIVKQFNWVDIVVVILLFRIAYVATKNGLPLEIFKLLGTVLAIYLALHYYTGLSDWIGGRLPVAQEKTPLEFLDFIVFIILAILGYLIFVLLRSIFYRFIKMDAVPRLNKWGGLVLGIIRGFLTVGLVVFMLAISSIGYLKNSVDESYSSSRLLKIAPTTYTGLWNNFMSKFMSKEKFNTTVTQIQ